MESLGWPPNFVAKCPVRLFEAAGGSNAWLPSGAAGALHMRPLGNAELYFQLRDLSDNQILFEHTMCKPDAFMVLSERFFVIQLEVMKTYLSVPLLWSLNLKVVMWGGMIVLSSPDNVKCLSVFGRCKQGVLCLERKLNTNEAMYMQNGSYRGFGFDECAAACETKTLVEKAVKANNLQDNSENSFTTTFAPEKPTFTGCTAKQNDSSSKSCASMSARPPTKPTQLLKEERVASAPSYDLVPFNPATPNSSKWGLSWKGLTRFSYWKSWKMISEAFGLQEHEMVIGYPTDVKHVAHIGLDGPSANGTSWIDELKPSPDSATEPLKESGRSNSSDCMHGTLSATKLITTGLEDQSGPPPGPPTEFLEPGTAPTHVKRSKWSLSWLRRKSRGSI